MREVASSDVRLRMERELTTAAGAGEGAAQIGRRTLVVGGLFALSGCGIFKRKPKDTTIEAQFVAGADINPSLSGQASPVVVRFYVLKDDSIFKQADFQSLYAKDSEVLGSTLVKKSQIVLEPSKTKDIKEKVSPDATAVGVFAAFRAYETAVWRAVEPLKASHVNKFLFTFSASSVSGKTQPAGWESWL